MDILIRYGFSIEEIKNMMDTNDELESIPDKDILELINVLINIGCHEEHIMNIFICNPLCLSKDVKEIKRIIKKLKEFKIKHLYMVIDSNPYILNMSIEELDNLYKTKNDEGLSPEEITDYFYHNIII